MERLLDVRELAPPLPLEQILDALDTLLEDDWLRVRLIREPYPLYAMLRQMGFAWDSQWFNNDFILRIWHTGYPPPDLLG